MLKLGDKPSLLELTHGAQALAHHLRVNNFVQAFRARDKAPPREYLDRVD